MALMCRLIWIYTVHPCHKGVFMVERVQQLNKITDSAYDNITQVTMSVHDPCALLKVTAISAQVCLH
jgi:hypothetical protein